MTPGLEAKPTWRSLILPLLLAALAFAAWQSSRREAEGITEDSSDFREALATWLPWLMARQGTPRAVKRFVNKLRYIAIRLRKGAGTAAGFPEPNTVALATIGFFDPDWLTDDADYQRVVRKQFDELLKTGTGQAAHLSAQDTTEVITRLSACIDQHAGVVSTADGGKETTARSYPWPPTPAHRKAFLAVLSQQSRGGDET